MAICTKHKRHLYFAAGALQVGLALAFAALATLGDCRAANYRQNYP